jgi:hypothetical protein
MLRGSVVVNAIVATLQTIPALVAVMPNGISGYSFLFGISKTLGDAIEEMLPGSLLVSYEGIQGGNFDMMTLWKHHLDITYRASNQAGLQNPIGTEDIGYLIFNQPVNNTNLNIRQVQILQSQLVLMDTPSLQHRMDISQQDYFQAHVVLPEFGDQP